MMLNSFTAFDLHLIPNSPLAMLTALSIITLLLMTSLNTTYILPTSRHGMSSGGIFMVTQMINTVKGSHLVGFHLTIQMFYIVILPLNLMGLVPWMFPPTSHLITTISLSIPLWMSMLIISMTKQPMAASSHYLPENTIPPLAPFLANVEQLSSSIRPLTLAFRMSANISAGHVILSLLGVTLSNSMIMIFPNLTMSLTTVMLFYLLFEIMVCMVQSYVFTLLCIMYSNDYMISTK